MNLFLNQNNRKLIKKKALEEPKGVFAKTLLCILIISSMIDFFLIALTRTLNYDYTDPIISTIIILLNIILITPLSLNYINLFLLNSKDEIITFSDLFKNFKRALKYTLLFTPIIGAYILGTFIISYLPFLGFIVNLIVTIIFTPVFIFMPYVYLDNNDLNYKELFLKTLKIVKNKRIEIYGLILSYIPWFIIGLFTMGILYFWIIPYLLIAITYQYQNFKDNSLKKEKHLSNQGIITIFVLALALIILAFSLNSKYEFNNFINTIFNYQILNNEGEYKLKYGQTMVATYNVPKGYDLAYETKTTKTFTNDENILQYTVYLAQIKDVIKLDKEITKNLKNLKEKEYTINLNNNKTTIYEYKTNDEQTIIAYYPKGSFVITISLSSAQSKNLTKNDIKNIIKIY